MSFMAVVSESIHCSGAMQKRQWFALRTRPAHEKRVAQQLSGRDVEIYLPQYQVIRRWKNRCTKVLHLPLFPGYMFARFAPQERLRVIELQSVVGLVGTRTGPSLIAEDEIEALRVGLELRKAVPHPNFAIGDRVRIRAGALAGMEGVLVRKKNFLRVVITLDLIMKSVAVEVDGADLEPVIRGGSAVSFTC